MNTFIMKNGETIKVDRFMQGPQLSAGYWWYSEGDNKVYREIVKPNISPFIFGYEPSKLLAKQYK